MVENCERVENYKIDSIIISSKQINKEQKRKETVKCIRRVNAIWLSLVYLVRDKDMKK